jgi:hypothetical protein
VEEQGMMQCIPRCWAVEIIEVHEKEHSELNHFQSSPASRTEPSLQVLLCLGLPRDRLPVAQKLPWWPLRQSSWSGGTPAAASCLD